MSEPNLLIQYYKQFILYIKIKLKMRSIYLIPIALLAILGLAVF